MAAKDFGGLDKPVRLTVRLSTATMIRLRVIVSAEGTTVEDAVGEAVRDWTLKREMALDRLARLELEGRMRKAFRGGSGKIASEGLTDPQEPSKVLSMSKQPDVPERAVEKEATILVRLPQGAHDALKDLAIREHRSMAQQLRYIIEQATRQDEESR